MVTTRAQSLQQAHIATQKASVFNDGLPKSLKRKRGLAGGTAQKRQKPTHGGAAKSCDDENITTQRRGGRLDYGTPSYKDSRKTFIVSLKVKFAIAPKLKRKPRMLKRTSPRTNKYGFTFGDDLLKDHTKPTPEDTRLVSEILRRERSASTSQGSTDGPAHAGSGVTVDSLVRIIMSQVLTNESALDAQQRLIHAYPYVVNGKIFYGTKPNYHAMRVESLQKLIFVAQKAGLHNTKPVQIKKCLDIIYQRNLDMLMPDMVVCRGNEPGATDFIPGLLSLDFLYDIYRATGRQGVLDYLLKLPQVGVKSACCLMSFNMDLPVFAMDTHVANMAKLLGWIPEDIKDENIMCSHLDTVMTDDQEKILLHQDFWHHRRSCARCSGRIKPDNQAWHNTFCPLEHLVKRPKSTDSLALRAAQRRAKNAAEGRFSAGKLSESPEDQNEDSTSPKKKSRPSAKKTPTDDELRAQGLIPVAYYVDDNFDADGALLIKRTIWIPDYTKVDFATLFPIIPEDEDDSQYEEIVIRKVVTLETSLIKKVADEVPMEYGHKHMAI